MSKALIIRFDLAALYPDVDWSAKSDRDRMEQARRWAKRYKREGMYIGGEDSVLTDAIEIGQVLDYVIDNRDGHTSIGLVIEWRDGLTISERIGG